MPPKLLLLTGGIGWRRKEGQALPEFLPQEEFTLNPWSKATRPQAAWMDREGRPPRAEAHISQQDSQGGAQTCSSTEVLGHTAMAQQPEYQKDGKDWKTRGNPPSERLGGRREGLDEKIRICYISNMFLYKTATASSILGRALWCSSSRYK